MNENKKAFIAIDNNNIQSHKGMHEKYMSRAIELAKMGRGFTDPNPVVGAVIVKDGEIIGEGYHERYGELHAERNAIADCKRRGNDPAGADIYVTLEPCCHHGKTPPCTEAIIENKIAHVYIGSNDPNPKVAEKSKAILDSAGIGQTRGILKYECDEMNTKFFHFITTGMPYVTLKYAMTADGKIASASGKSQWITGEPAREYVHALRHEHAGIMAGIGTVLADDPMLNCRLENAGPHGASNPVRIIMDTNLRIPMDSKIVKTAKDIRTIIVTADTSSHEAKEQALIAADCEILKVRAVDTGSGKDSADVHEALVRLGEMKISSILVEGGGTLAYSVLKSGAVNKVNAFIAPKFLGGVGAKTPVGGEGFDDPNTCPKMKFTGMQQFGDDLLIEYEV
jgi:diaminohydroxyphosphoribosylaminopyrimidine deaminase/5-amino-6-(5-phosphoribosylamino)uracil reductase